MCTVSWLVQPGGYDLFFNRDELVTRVREEPPALDRHDGLAWIAPRDGSGGGTWLGVNEGGITVCLLNDYETPWRQPTLGTVFSRGQVTLAGLTATTLTRLHEKVLRAPLDRTPPFQLLALSPVERPRLWRWNGAHLRTVEPEMPFLSSSSVQTEQIVTARRSRFRSLWNRSIVRTATLAAFHREHTPGRGAQSVLMRRPDASTRSIIHVSVREGRARLSYQAVTWAPSGPALTTPLRSHLPLRPSFQKNVFFAE